jgi:hypothetical protein
VSGSDHIARCEAAAVNLLDTNNELATKAVVAWFVAFQMNRVWGLRDVCGALAMCAQS